MNAQLFTVMPNRDNTNYLRTFTRKIICEKIASIVQQIGEQLSMDFYRDIQPLTDDNHGIVNPALFHYYFQLKAAIESEQLDSILDVIHLLSHQPVVVQQQRAGCPDICSAVDSEWERNLLIKTIRKEVVSDFGIEHDCELVRPVFRQALEGQIIDVRAALSLLESSDSLHRYAATEHLLAIKLFEGTVRGFSYQAAYGHIYLRLPKVTDSACAYYLEHIVHECAHQHLFALQLIDPMVLNPPSELFEAPIRLQKRPMHGIFHACFVLARMVRCFRKAHSDLVKDKEARADFLKRIESWFEKSYDTVEQYAKLSEPGRLLFNTFKACAYE